MPGDQQSGAELRSLLDADLAGGDPLGQIRYGVLGGIGLLLLDQIDQILMKTHRAFLHRIGRRIASQTGVGVFLEELMVLVGHPEHVADHAGGYRKGEFGDHVGGLRTGEDLVDALVGDLLDHRPQALDTPEGERFGQHPAEAGVLLGIGGEHRPGPLVDGRQHVLVPVREALAAVVDADTRVREQRPGHLVPRHQPRCRSVPDPHP